MHDDTVPLHGLRALLDHAGEALVKGIRKTDMADDAALKECKGPDALGAVDDLVGHDKVHGLDLGLQRADGREGDHAPHPDVSQRRDVGARGHLVRRKLVVEAVARDEGDGHAIVLEDVYRRRGKPPGRLGIEGRDWLVAFEVGEAGASDDPDMDRLCGSGETAGQRRWNENRERRNPLS